MSQGPTADGMRQSEISIDTDALLLRQILENSHWDFAIKVLLQIHNIYHIISIEGHSDESPDYTFGACAGRYGCRRRRFFSSATGDLPGRYVYVPQATPPPPPPSTKISFGAFFFWFFLEDALIFSI